MEGPPYSCACVSRRRWTSTSPPRAPRTKETSWPVLEVAGTGIIVHTYACMCRRKYYLAFCIHTSCHRVQMSESLSRECCAPLDTLRSRKYTLVKPKPYTYTLRDSGVRVPRGPRGPTELRGQTMCDSRCFGNHSSPVLAPPIAPLRSSQAGARALERKLSRVELREPQM